MDIGALAGNLLSGGLLGGLTGLIGNGLTAFTNYKTQKLKNNHELAMAEQDRLNITAEADAAVKIEQERVKGVEIEGELAALTESYKQSSKSLFHKSYMDKMPKWIATTVGLMFAFIDFLKGAARPVLTYYLMGASTWLTMLTYDMLQKMQGQALTQEQAYDLFNLLVTTIVYLTVTCVTWWFADRRMAKFLMRLDDGNLKK